MKKRISGKTLSRSTNERKRLFRNLIASVAQHGFIVTSRTKAKAIQPLIEKLVTKGKEESLTSFRRLISETGSPTIARQLQVVARAFKDRPGGYTRLIHIASSSGNNGPRARLEWTEKTETSTKTIPPEKKLTPKTITKIKSKPKKTI